MILKKKNKCDNNAKKKEVIDLFHNKSFLTPSTRDSNDTEDSFVSSLLLPSLLSLNKMQEVLKDDTDNSKQEIKLLQTPTKKKKDVDESSISSKTIISTCEFNDLFDLNFEKNEHNNNGEILNKKTLDLSDKLTKVEGIYTNENNSCKISVKDSVNRDKGEKNTKEKKSWYPKLKLNFVFDKKSKNSVKFSDFKERIDELKGEADVTNKDTILECNIKDRNIMPKRNEIASVTNVVVNKDCNSGNNNFENRKEYAVNPINYFMDREVSKYLLSKIKFFLKNNKTKNESQNLNNKNSDKKKIQIPKSKVIRNGGSRIEIDDNSSEHDTKFTRKNEFSNQSNDNVDNNDQESIILDEEYIKMSGVNLVEPFLEPKRKEYYGKKTLVLDLDETLIHSSFQPIRNPSFIIKIEIEGDYYDVYVLKRPGVDKFLDVVTSLFEVVIFTASLSKYANPLLNQLDPLFKCPYRLFRENCTVDGNSYIKDLSKLGRPLKDIIIIDNSPISYILQPENAIPISSWFNDENDKQLYELIPLLEFIANGNLTISTSFGSLSDFAFDFNSREQKELIEFNANTISKDNKFINQLNFNSCSINCLNSMDEIHNNNNTNKNIKNKKNSNIIYLESSLYNKTYYY
ncbi:hypothetical protein FG386_001573 [Cryptosporidium ryanae]|uniref:uncharacterized protein n=1 Tax=Cryptosporidium ryanae TaxID=515981 RepID=UPI00351A8405|nr:hypothetical protein FG386_001573 [Cryptosporidium ryanae]